MITNRFYIGMHSTNDLNDGYMGSGKRLRCSLNKYGKENHKLEILEYCKDREELINRETEIVNDNLINESLCMNLKPGGRGGFTKEQSTKGAFSSHEKIKWLRENDKDWVCKTRNNKSESKKKSFLEGRSIVNLNFVYSFTDKLHSEETKLKIGEKTSKLQKGENNSQFGTCWIFNEQLKENKKIKKVELDNYLKLGWIKGRKL